MLGAQNGMTRNAHPVNSYIASEKNFTYLTLNVSNF